MASFVDFKNKVFHEGTHSITLDYGYTYKDGSFHKGVDLVTGRNVEDYVVAIEDGTVYECANNINGQTTDTGTRGMGNYVILQHANGWRTRYQHLKYGSVVVKKGQADTFISIYLMHPNSPTALFPETDIMSTPSRFLKAQGRLTALKMKPQRQHPLVMSKALTKLLTMSMSERAPAPATQRFRLMR